MTALRKLYAVEWRPRTERVNPWRLCVTRCEDNLEDCVACFAVEDLAVEWKEYLQEEAIDCEYRVISLLEMPDDCNTSS